MVNFVEKDQSALVNMIGRLDAIAEKESVDGYVKNDIEMQEKRNDAIKNKYCNDNNIKLIRISYLEKNNINIKMLMGDD